MLVLAVAGALAASYTDFKRGIIPNRLSFTLFFAGIAGNVTIALSRGDASLILDLAKAVLATFAVGYALWLLGGMAAGDVKEFLFLAALLPRYPEVLLRHFSPALASYPFPISIFVNTFIIAFPFLYLYALLLALKKVEAQKFLEPLRSPEKLVKNALYLAGASSLGIALQSTLMALAVVAVTFFLLKRELHRLVLAGGALLLSLGKGVPPEVIAEQFLLIAGVLLLFALFWNSLRILREALKEEVKITALEEGAIPAEEIYIRNGEVIREEKSIVDKIKEYASSGTMKRGTKIAGTSAAGLTERQIASLRRLVEEGRLEDRIKIKARMPFAPAIFIGLVITLMYGDLGKMVRL